MEQRNAIGELSDCCGRCLPHERVHQRMLCHARTGNAHVLAGLGIHLDVVQIRHVCKEERTESEEISVGVSECVC